MILRRQFVEGAVIIPADQVFARDLADDFVAAFFLEDLLERLELGHAFDPFLRLELLLKPLSGEGPLGDVVDLVLMLDLEIGEVGIDGGADVARERPGGGGPDEEVFPWRCTPGRSPGNHPEACARGNFTNTERWATS